MPDMEIREATEADFESILALNDGEVQQTSAMDLARLRYLHGLSSYHRVVEVNGRVGAFLLAMRSGAAYENQNFNWFTEQVGNFLYVDRIVVGADFAGLGIGSALYRDLFAHARALGIPAITCEYNIEPPNPASRAFHDKFGFRELGTQWVAGGSKRVSLQAAAI
jgi:predicted GNAT superfamily acetyltransferase